MPDFKKFREKARRLTLSRREKEAMREELIAHMRQHPAPVRSPFTEGGAGYALSFIQLSKTRFASAALIVALVVMSAGGGVAYAAESALPGDALYAIKVNVNEEVREAIILDEEAKAEWIARRAERRLEEARMLAARDALTAETAAMLTHDFEMHSARVASHLSELEETRPDIAANISVTFEAVLAAHSDMLAEVSNNAAHALSTQVEARSQRFASRVGPSDITAARAPAIAQATEAADMRTSEDDATNDGTLSIATTLSNGEENSKGSERRVAEEREAVAEQRAIATAAAEAPLGKIASRIFLTAEEKIEMLEKRTERAPEAERKQLMRIVEDATAHLERARAALAADAHADALREARTIITIVTRVELALRTETNIPDIVFPALLPLPESPVSDFPGRPADSGDSDEQDADNSNEREAIEIEHAYQNGTHIFRGTITVPTPCHELETDVVVAESFPEQITLQLTTYAQDGICAQVLAEKPFSISVRAHQDARIRATLNGEPIEVVLNADAAFESSTEPDIATTSRETDSIETGTTSETEGSDGASSSTSSIIKRILKTVSPTRE